MSATNKERGPERARRRLALRLESLESRELLTVMPGLRTPAISPAVVAAIQSVSNIQALSQGSGTGSNTAKSSPTAPLSIDQIGSLTPHEIQRETYVARFKGNYLIGPGRTTRQAAALTAINYGGGNQSLHYWANMRIVLPTDATQPAVGLIYIIPKSIGTTGTQLALDLTSIAGSPTVDGFPTLYSWTVDPASAGIYTNAGGYGTGAGTLNIRFFPEGRGASHNTLKGKLNFAVNGLIDVAGNGLFNDIGVLGNLPNHDPNSSARKFTSKL